MPTLNLLAYAFIGLAVTWGLYLIYMYVATRASEGLAADPLFKRFPELAAVNGKALVYCYAPHCGPCRPMSKEVDILAETGAPVFKFDVTDDPALSREMGIRATPTLILIEDGVVSRMLLGVRTANYMHGLIASHAR